MAEPHVLPPPASKRGDDVDVYRASGSLVEVPDPYRWLEDGTSSATQRWVEAHNTRTRQALDARPDWRRWHERLCALVGLPTMFAGRAVEPRGEHLFCLERLAGGDQYVLTVRSANTPGEPRVLVDAGSAADDHAVAIDWFVPSPDGSLVAYGLSEGGTENSTLHVLRVDSGEVLDVKIADTRAASVAWKPDNSGFWYTRYPAGANYGRHVRLHVLGTDPADDAVVFDRPVDSTDWPSVQVSDSGDHLLVTLMVGWDRVDLHLLDVHSGTWTALSEGHTAQHAFEFHDDHLVGVTTLDAPNGRVVAISLDSLDEWRTVVAQSHVVLGQMCICADEVLVVASSNAVDRVQRWRLDGTRAGDDLDLGIVGVEQLVCDDAVAFVTVSAFDRPPTTWRIDPGRAIEAWCPSSVEPPVSLTVTQHTYRSLDGTEIGLFVVHHADQPPTPTTRLMLTGYGGFALSYTPVFSPNIVAWCEAGGAYAVALLRGGFEHGEQWHHAGRRAKKQRVFDDFHAAADHLVANGFTSRDRLGIVGGSNGGLLMGVAMTQRPDLAAAVWCAVPLLDMVRFPQFLIARLWTDEYGDPDVPEEFDWVWGYSPYHKVVDAQRYPAVLFTTAEGDTRVDPLHARKMAARMIDAAPVDGAPVLLYQEGRAGHGVGKPASKKAAEGADVLTFMAWQLAPANAV